MKDNLIIVDDCIYALYLMHETAYLKKEGRHNGHVIAVRVTEEGRGYPFLEYVYDTTGRNIEGVASLYQGRNKEVVSCSISQALIEELAVPCSVESAQKFHPELLIYMKGWQRYG